MTVDDAAELRAIVALGCRVLGDEGQDDFTLGHVGVRDPDGRGVWMKGKGKGLTEVDSDFVLLVDASGEVLAGDAERHIEYPIHTEVLAARSDVAAVVHTHPPHSVALGAAGVPLLPVSHGATMFVPPDIPRFDRTSELITTPELGRELAAALSDHHAILLVNHGIVTVGATLQEAVVRAVMLERAARQQLLTASFGSGWPSWTPVAESARKQAMWTPAVIEDFWEYLVRSLTAERGRA
jgi:ribulose-5-phosphate 4-epimerase/fuculose-1-phosphate aldolase